MAKHDEKVPEIYEEDVYVNEQEDDDGDILKSAGKDRLLKIEGRKEKGARESLPLSNTEYRDRALTLLLATSFYEGRVNVLLRDAEVVARWLAGEDRPEDAPQAASQG